MFNWFKKVFVQRPLSDPDEVAIRVAGNVGFERGLTDCTERAICLANWLYKQGWNVFIQFQKSGYPATKGHAYVKAIRGGEYKEFYKREGEDWYDAPANGGDSVSREFTEVARYNMALTEPTENQMVAILMKDTDFRVKGSDPVD